MRPQLKELNDNPYLTHYTSEQDCEDITDMVANYYVNHTIDKGVYLCR